MKCIQFAVIIWCLVHFQYGFGQTITEKFAWKTIEFEWPGDEAGKVAEKSRRNYIPENNLPLSIDVWGDTLFVAIPRYLI